MPQLNPNPWFSIMTSLWIIFLLIMQPKSSTTYFPNSPSHKTKPTLKPLSWSWPWT
uniref:ATP synthase complex subunit 8 n=1 Tax=Tinamus major TaxID=30468 RepID=Q958E0_TINMA|nr:ATP synthase F0 subunit 8 [Tinamus major]AAK53243.1 ATPase 8 [Tinamus major]